MACYIYLDSQGKELRREDKGRGKPKKDAIKREDGNFYIAEVTSPSSPKVEENAPESVEVIDSGQEHFKVRKTSHKTTLANLVKCLHFAPKDYIQGKNKLTILRPAVKADIGIDEAIMSNGVYGKIEANLSENVIYVWLTWWNVDKDGKIARPDYIVRNALDIKSDIVEENL